MPVFAVIRQSSSDVLSQAIKREYPDAHYDLGHGAWLVAGIGTAKDVSDKLGITPLNESVGTAVVFEAASYYGRANPAIWTWIKSRWEGTSNG